VNKEVLINVDASSWPLNQSPPQALFNPSHSFNIPSVLLQIGELTTPPHRGGISLSEYWAYVRYFNALTSSTSLELTHEYGGLDSHQKTILSDDFGIGFSINYLMGALSLAPPVNGQFFIDSMLGATGGTYSGKKPEKRGPGKSPDYIAQDNAGMWHIIECKGTQTSLEYSNTQLSKGVSQKNTVSFPFNVRGERLVAGLFIGSEGADEHSTLTIRDPKAEKPFQVPADALGWARDTMNRGALAASLQQAGFPATANIVAAPMGTELDAKQIKFKKRENTRRESVQVKQANSIKELENSLSRSPIGNYIGRSAEFDVPGLEKLTDGKVSRVKVSNGFSKGAINRLLKPDEYEARPTLIQQMNIHTSEMKRTSSHDGNFAEIRYGSLYRARLELLA